MPPYGHARSAFDTRFRRGFETSFASSVRCVHGARSAGRSAKRLVHKSAGEFQSRSPMVRSSYWKASECELFRACPTILIGLGRHAGKKMERLPNAEAVAHINKRSKIEAAPRSHPED